ncbi:MAG: hypothetical protein ACR2KK_08155 [Acidimicrobiales bacterium]
MAANEKRLGRVDMRRSSTPGKWRPAMLSHLPGAVTSGRLFLAFAKLEVANRVRITILVV